MTRAVLDASVIVKWFQTTQERHVDEARRLRSAFETGKLTVFAPTLMPLEILNVAGRAWRWKRADILSLADLVDSLPFELQKPPLRGVAEWISRGLSAYDASYAAISQAENIPLVTDDAKLLSIAGSVSMPLAGIR